MADQPIIGKIEFAPTTNHTRQTNTYIRAMSGLWYRACCPVAAPALTR